MEKYSGRIMRVFLVLFILSFCSCRETLIHDLSELEANTVLVHLHSSGIASFKKHQPDGAWSIQVEQRNAVAAMQALSARRLLRKSPPERKSAGSVLASREQQQLQYERALSSEIEYTLASVPGVLDARVHLNLPDRDPLLGEFIETEAVATASVLLIVTPAARLVTDDLKQLVSGAAGIPHAGISLLTSAAAEPQVALQLEKRVPSVGPPAAGRLISTPDLHMFASVLSSIVAIFYLGYLIKRRRLFRKIQGLERVLGHPEEHA